MLYTQNSTQNAFQTLSHFERNLDLSWKIQVFYNSKCIPLNQWHTKLNNSNIQRKDRFLFTDAGDSVKDRATLNRFLIFNTTFWRAIVGDVILIFQPDSCICNRSPYHIDLFTVYDYIGAPFHYNWVSESKYHPSVPYRELIPFENNEFYGGNGGFSIRSRKSMIDCSLLALPHQNDEDFDGLPEDIYFSYCVKHKLNRQVKLPTKQVSAAFSVENSLIINPQPFGQHKAFKYMLNATDLAILSANCPDLIYSQRNHNAMDQE